LLTQLQDLEKKIDHHVARKQIELGETFRARTNRVSRTLRLSISNSYENQAATYHVDPKADVSLVLLLSSLSLFHSLSSLSLSPSLYPLSLLPLLPPFSLSPLLSPSISPLLPSILSPSLFFPSTPYLCCSHTSHYVFYLIHPLSWALHMQSVLYEPPSWTLRIEGGLLEDPQKEIAAAIAKGLPPPAPRPRRRFSCFWKKVVVVLDERLQDNVVEVSVFLPSFFFPLLSASLRLCIVS
jgi:hypothetical protein